MALNNAVTASLVLLTDPPSDAQCVSTLTEILQGAASYLSVEITNPAEVASDGSSIANQALNVANTALATAQATAAAMPQRRAQSTPQPIPGGGQDSNLNISWTPDMPDSNYEVNGTFYGPANATAFPGTYYVVDSTRTISGCTIRLCNIPNNFSFAWSVTDLSTA